MNLLKVPKNRQWMKNALIIILSLFDENAPDLYSNIGKNVKLVSKQEKEEIFSRLKEELNI